MTDDAPVLLANAGGVLTVTLNRPAKRNAIDEPMLRALHAALDQADLDGTVRVVVLRGAGTDFCAGVDLHDLLASADRSMEENRASARRFADVLLRIREIPKPVIAVVQGRAMGGGAGLATAADLVYGARSARFVYPEIQRGFVPAVVLALLRRACPDKVAFDLVATGRPLEASEAAAWGLVSRVCDEAELESVVAGVAERLASSSASALALTKQLFYQLDGLSLSEGLERGAAVNAVSRAGPDFRAALQEFLKR